MYIRVIDCKGIPDRGGFAIGVKVAWSHHPGKGTSRLSIEERQGNGCVGWQRNHKLALVWWKETTQSFDIVSGAQS